ncbi:hypothetical protein HPY28_19320 [Brevibacillus sp. HB1.2]|uniref:hypothetical protein n=1 Tax=Brevibacillus sp. HB1.2 TaxID=2738807 RepID=UPI0015759C32|nr:hypothetical protein [Brevibacillus sp. HB1.2]NTU22476.1 hypothetical protein [Brevibacillus sp. HB1.2]
MYRLNELIWILVKHVLEGMSRKQAIVRVTKERGLNQEDFQATLLWPIKQR